MNKIVMYGWFVFIITSVCIPVTAELTKEDIMGDPKVALAPILPDIQWLTGSTLGIFIVVGIVGIFFGGIIYFGGSAVGHSGAKSSGISGVIGCVAVGLIVSMALTMFISIAI